MKPKKTYKLRPHQKKLAKDLKKALKKYDHVLFHGPTGIGKSVQILDLIHHVLKKGKRVLVIAPRRKLVFQLMETFADYNPALLMGSDRVGDPKSSPLVVASLQTLASRLKKYPDTVGEVDFFVADEAHISLNFPADQKKWKLTAKAVRERYWDRCKWVGFTATPITETGKPLEGWETIVTRYDTRWLIEHGWLARFEYYALPAIDTKNLRTSSTGDYNLQDIEEAVSGASEIEAVLEAHRKYHRSKTMIFAASITHAEMIRDRFDDPGICIVHSQMPEKVAHRTILDFERGLYHTVVNVGILTTGFDDPSVETLIIARPSKSRRLYLQIVGRGLRGDNDLTFRLSKYEVRNGKLVKKKKG